MKSISLRTFLKLTTQTLCGKNSFKICFHSKSDYYKCILINLLILQGKSWVLNWSDARKLFKRSPVIVYA